MTKTRHPKIYIGKIAAYPEKDVRRALERLAFLCESERDSELRDYLGELLPEARLLNGRSGRPDPVGDKAFTEETLNDLRSYPKTLYSGSDAS